MVHFIEFKSDLTPFSGGSPELPIFQVQIVKSYLYLEKADANPKFIWCPRTR